MAPTLAALSLYLFGITALLAGIITLVNPSTRAAGLCESADAGNALAAIAMGLYYPLAAYQENRHFFLISVPMRTLSTIVFWRYGRADVAAWEGLGAALTAIALMVGGRPNGKLHKY